MEVQLVFLVKSGLIFLATRTSRVHAKRHDNRLPKIFFQAQNALMQFWNELYHYQT